VRIGWAIGDTGGYLKNLCKECGFENPQQYKLHTFRHFFASYCAQHNLSYKYILEWMGHSSSAILDIYFWVYTSQ
jgi:integrase